MLEAVAVLSLLLAFGSGVMATLSIQAMPRKRRRRSTFIRA